MGARMGRVWGEQKYIIAPAKAEGEGGKQHQEHYNKRENN